MTLTLAHILIIVAVICFVIAAIQPAPWAGRLVAVGLAFFAAAFLL